MPDLPDPVDLAQAIESRSGISSGAAWLVDNAQLVDGYASVEDWAVDTGAEGPVAHHLVAIRAELARELWARHLFVGVSVLDELVFDSVRRRLNPILETLSILLNSSLTNPTYVIYPLHSFGIPAAGLLGAGEVESEGLAREYGLAVSSQHNRMSNVIEWLQSVHEWFEVSGTVPNDLIHHWRRSRARWLEINPLLAVKVHSLVGTSYYENQRLLLDRLLVATSFLAGLALRQPAPPPDASALFSTRRVNNWATLDIHHYFVMSSRLDESGAITGDAVPMNVNSGYLAELSDVPVELDLPYWSSHAPEARVLWESLEMVSSLQLATRFRRGRQNRHQRARTARKMFESLDWFRRSLAPDRWYAVTSLGTAFEMILTSHYASGVTERLRRRTELLTGDQGAADAVAKVYDARSALVHHGVPPADALPLAEAQKAFLSCFQMVAAGLNTVRADESDPLRLITRDGVVDLPG